MAAKAISGANDVEVQVGQTVGAIRLANADVLNIADNAEVRLNGQPVNDEYVIQADDTIEFIRPAGSKG